MKFTLSKVGALGVALTLGSSLAPVQLAFAQDADALIEEVVVTGSRIRRNPLDESAAIMDLSQADLDRTGLTNLGDALQELPITGSAPNSQFNVPGNSGFPQDGAGIGAGSVQMSLRNLGAKRTLILVDGRRWVAGASASGVPGTVDLNTIPDNVIERVEILQDGASAIYGSDAIGGVINIITKKDFDGFQFDTQYGSYLSEGDGESFAISGLWGGGTETTHLMVSASYADESDIETASRSRSAYPSPDATSCAAGGCSSFTPQARLVLGPNFGFQDITLNDGVLNDGMTNIPQWDPLDPEGGADFHSFSSADRFNFNGPGYNFLRTPNERINLYSSVRHEFNDTLALIFTGSYTNRKSATKAAPEPLCLGNECGNAINDNFLISATNPYNPFGIDLSVANGNLEFFGRRPLESGGRRFFQDINSYMLTTGLEGEFDAGSKTFYWDLMASYGDNRGFQEKYGAHNAAKLQVAMGDIDVCNATPNCVPFNFFGGQGPDGNGSITQEMLDFVGFVQRDFSEQTLVDYAFNITGDLVSLPAGEMGFAAGLEYREHSGSYRPDPIAALGETAGIPAGATAGSFDVTEFYAELNIPLLADRAFFDYLELNVAARNSDYSTSGSESTYKASLLWRPIETLSFRGSVSTGFRAPGIGELFGGAARQDFTFLDPCADVLGTIPAADGGRQETGPQSATIIANCATLGVGPGLAQTNPQLSAVSAGNPDLVAETSDNWSVGFVWSPAFADGANWTDGITTSIDLYSVEIINAVQGANPGDVIDACVNTLDPFFCDSATRGSSGRLNVIENPLQNIGSIEASGLDLMFNYLTPEFGIGQFGLLINATYLEQYIETVNNADGSKSVNDLTGLHTDETFQRAFPEWRAVTSVDWFKDRFSGSLVFRWFDDMTLDSGSNLDSVMFTDLRVSYNPSIANEAMTITLGINNVFDEDPSLCDACGVIGLSNVVHDLPGTVGYVRFTYRP
jgi:iron complex outermembrane receptor protein